MNNYALISNPLVIALAAMIIGLIVIIYLIATARSGRRRDAASHQQGFDRIRREEAIRREEDKSRSFWP